MRIAMEMLGKEKEPGPRYPPLVSGLGMSTSEEQIGQTNIERVSENLPPGSCADPLHAMLCHHRCRMSTESQRDRV